jgi:hypothetical protein
VFAALGQRVGEQVELREHVVETHAQQRELALRLRRRSSEARGAAQPGDELADARAQLAPA